jgi:hypothetical protein
MSSDYQPSDVYSTKCCRNSVVRERHVDMALKDLLHKFIQMTQRPTVSYASNLTIKQRCMNRRAFCCNRNHNRAHRTSTLHLASFCSVSFSNQIQGLRKTNHFRVCYPNFCFAFRKQQLECRLGFQLSRGVIPLISFIGRRPPPPPAHWCRTAGKVYTAIAPLDHKPQRELSETRYQR